MSNKVNDKQEMYNSAQGKAKQSQLSIKSHESIQKEYMSGEINVIKAISVESIRISIPLCIFIAVIYSILACESSWHLTPVCHSS